MLEFKDIRDWDTKSCNVLHMIQKGTTCIMETKGRKTLQRSRVGTLNEENDKKYFESFAFVHDFQKCSRAFMEHL